jgi:hypothetical protein
MAPPHWKTKVAEDITQILAARTCGRLTAFRANLPVSRAPPAGAPSPTLAG